MKIKTKINKWGLTKPKSFCVAGVLGGTEDKNLPANAGDMGSTPGPGRFHTLQSK